MIEYKYKYLLNTSCFVDRLEMTLDLDMLFVERTLKK
jgi:hypothetical protein